MISKKKLRTVAKLAWMLWLAASLSNAQSGSVIIGTANSDNCLPYSCGYTDAFTEFQQHFAASAFGVSGPISITDFVLTAGSAYIGGQSDTGTFNIYLSTAVNHLGGDSTTLVNNIGPDNVLFATVAFGPNMPATFTVTGNAPFVYNPANGDLLIDVKFPGSTRINGSESSYFNADETGTVTQRNYTSSDDGVIANEGSGLVTQFDYTTGGSAAASQTITFLPLSNQVYGSTPPPLSAMASSELAVMFGSLTQSICTVGGNTVMLIAVGTCTIQATQGGDTDYAPAQPVNQSFMVTQESQFISFASLSNQTIGATPPTLSAMASSGLPVMFSPTTPNTCSVMGTTVQLVSVGTCGIQASQPGNMYFAAAVPVTQTFTISSGLSTLQITSSGALGEFVPGAGVSATPVATGGQAPYIWTATGLPAGFNFNSSTGAFSGAAPAPGVYNFTLKVTDSESSPASATLQVAFSVLGIATTSLPAGSTTATYSQQIVAIGGTPPYSFTGSGVPAGLTLSPAGLLSGTPSAVGTFALVVQVKDATGLSASSNLSLTVNGTSSQPLSVPGGPLTGGNAGSSYSASVTATGGTPPYTWTQTGRVLPDGGVTLSNSGAISGTPKTPGTYTFTVQATDSANATALGTFTIAIAPATLTLTSLSFPIGTVTTPYPLQILSATGGVAPYTFSISNGSLPAGLTFSSPQFSGTPTTANISNFTLTVTDSAGNTASAPTYVAIRPYSVSLILSQSTAPFSLTVGSNGVPPPASVTIQSNDVTQILNYSVTVTPPVSWLDVSSGGTTTPGSIGIAVDPSALSLGATVAPYQTAVNVICVVPSPCAGAIQTINVSLNITSPAPQLTLTSSLISFSALTSNPVAQSQPLGIQNTGGGTLDITSVTPADSWLTVSGVPSTLAAGPATPITVTASPAGVTGAGYYQSSLTVVSSAGTIVLPVTLNLAQSLTMTLGPSGATIQSVTGNPPGNPTGSFNISVTGGGSIGWSASVLPGASWLSVSTPSGTSTAATPGTVSYAIDPTISAGLSAQTYIGSIQVTSGDVVDSPLVFQLYLNVNPPNTPPSPQPGSSGLVYISAVGASSSQTIPIYASSTTPVNYQASVTTADGGTWLTVSPATGLTSASAPGQSVITTNATGLLAGATYRGGVTYGFSSDAVSTVNITLVVEAAPAGPTTSSTFHPSASTPACTPTKLIPTQTGLVNNFAQPAGWPTPIAINVLNDCGLAVPGAQVITTFTNGDPPLVLEPSNNSSGTFVGTWTPRSVSSQVTVMGQASLTGLPSVSVLITGEVRPNSPPILTANTPTHVFNPVIGGSLAPGTIIQIYGSNLAAQTTPSQGALTTNLGQTQVLIGGIPAPLYYVSPGQVNAQIPYELTAGNQYQVIVDANGVTSTPAPIQLTAAVPGIAAYTTGEILAQHQADYSLVTEASPAVPGEYVIFYLAGLGATNAPVATGQPAPSNPPASAVVPLTLTLNGSPIPTAFVGLTPSAVGLYQVDFQIPAGTPNGDLNLVVSQSGLPSNMTILPVQQ